MEKTAQEMEINYMKNYLSKEEVELRKRKSNLYLTVVVVIVIILLSGFFSYIKHEQSGETMDSFKSFSNNIVTSTRDSQQQNNNNPLTGESIACSMALE